MRAVPQAILAPSGAGQAHGWLVTSAAAAPGDAAY
jgi:hypothetical protein